MNVADLDEWQHDVFIVAREIYEIDEHPRIRKSGAESAAEAYGSGVDRAAVAVVAAGLAASGAANGNARTARATLRVSRPLHMVRRGASGSLSRAKATPRGLRARLARRRYRSATLAMLVRESRCINATPQHARFCGSAVRLARAS